MTVINNTLQQTRLTVHELQVISFTIIATVHKPSTDIVESVVRQTQLERCVCDESELRVRHNISDNVRTINSGRVIHQLKYYDDCITGKQFTKELKSQTEG